MKLFSYYSSSSFDLIIKICEGALESRGCIETSLEGKNNPRQGSNILWASFNGFQLKDRTFDFPYDRIHLRMNRHENASNSTFLIRPENALKSGFQGRCCVKFLTGITLKTPLNSILGLEKPILRKIWFKLLLIKFWPEDTISRLCRIFYYKKYAKQLLASSFFFLQKNFRHQFNFVQVPARVSF